MSGLKSRRKGMYNEYGLRDYLRMLGYDAERVPLSGASAAMKGDVVAKKDGKTLFVEVKSRKDQFKLFYVLYEDYIRTMKDDLLAFCYPEVDSMCVQMSSSFDGVFTKANYYPMLKAHPMYQEYSRTMTAVANTKKYLGGADILALKIDRKPFLFLRFI